MKAIVFGASGGLAEALTHELLTREWHVDLVTREAKQQQLASKFSAAIAEGRTRVLSVPQGYASFHTDAPCDAYFFTQALFSQAPLISMSAAAIAEEIQIGLIEIIALTRNLLSAETASPQLRREYCFIGSTSAYAGAPNTAVYCAVKHGLLGFVRALNSEYEHTGIRFWLFSMGTMNTAMGRKLTDQDANTFLDPADVAERIVAAMSTPSNIFEPEVILRRRTIRFVNAEKKP